ncbi:MAG: hypothetical protein IPI57_15820 [Candidatus Competibacteraceae bacterium]|nr:hypothetical protein [Candidatus Competibacteraceae bacterium]
MKLRDYQANILSQVATATTNDMVQLDTGAGKTPVEAALAKRDHRRRGRRCSRPACKASSPATTATACPPIHPCRGC